MFADKKKRADNGNGLVGLIGIYFFFFFKSDTHVIVNLTMIGSAVNNNNILRLGIH